MTIDADGHDVRDVLDPDLGVLGIVAACWECGLYYTTSNKGKAGMRPSCNSVRTNPAMKCYQKGGDKDPFKKYRDEVTTLTVTSAGSGYDDKPETRPGLATESIDRAEYDRFMAENFK